MRLGLTWIYYKPMYVRMKNSIKTGKSECTAFFALSRWVVKIIKLQKNKLILQLCFINALNVFLSQGQMISIFASLLLQLIWWWRFVLVKSTRMNLEKSNRWIMYFCNAVISAAWCEWPDAQVCFLFIMYLSWCAFKEDDSPRFRKILSYTVVICPWWVIVGK